MNKAVKYLSTIVLSAMFILILFNTYQNFYPFKTIEYYDMPAKVDTVQLRAGETLVYHVNYCKFTDKSAEVTRQLIGRDDNPEGATVTQIQILPSNVPPGCKNVTGKTLIPANTLPGHYYMKTTGKYHVHRDIEKTWQTQEFEVLPNN